MAKQIDEVLVNGASTVHRRRLAQLGLPAMSAFPPLAKPPALIWIKLILAPQNIPYAAENKCRAVMILWRALLQPSDLFLAVLGPDWSAIDSGQSDWSSRQGPLWFPSHGAAPPAFGSDPGAEGEREIDGPAFVDRIAALANDRGSYFNNDGLPGSCIYPQQGGCD
jgi:hypothetical protein